MALLRLFPLASLLLFCTAYAEICPILQTVTIVGDEDKDDSKGWKFYLSGVKMTTKLTMSWADTSKPQTVVGSMNGGVFSPSALQYNASDFGITMSGSAKLRGELSFPADSTEIMTYIEFIETGDQTLTFSVTHTGNCNVEPIEFKGYVHWKHWPIMPVFVLLIITPLTRNVFMSLIFAAWFTSVIKERDLWQGFMRFWGPDVVGPAFSALGEIMMFMFVLGGVIGASIRSGGVQDLGDRAARFIKDSFLGQFVTFCFGWVIFMDDYSNTAIVGSTLRAVTDKVRVSREKLSFIVDCTASPIAGLMPLSTWIAYELQQIGSANESIGFTLEDKYSMFLRSIPNRFYAWFMIAFVLFNCVSGRDWGPMYYAEKRARAGKGVVDMGGKSEEEFEDMMPVKPKQGIPWRWYNFAIPITVFLVSFVPLLFYSGNQNLEAKAPGIDGWSYDSKTLLQNANAFWALRWAASIAAILQIVLYSAQYDKSRGDGLDGCLLRPGETMAAMVSGTKIYFEGMLALLLAFIFAYNLRSLHLATWCAEALGDSLTATSLPAVVFCLCCIFSMATGTSWGTMAVFFPVAAVLLDRVSRHDTNSEAFANELAATYASVLGGSVWGDHCSPVSDTTILSATASQVPLLDHTKTQLPYALYCGIMAILLGYLPSASGAPATLMLFIGWPLLCSGHLLLSLIPGLSGPPVEIFTPSPGGGQAAKAGVGFSGAFISLQGLVKGFAQAGEEKTANGSSKQDAAAAAAAVAASGATVLGRETTKTKEKPQDQKEAEVVKEKSNGDMRQRASSSFSV
mmetsp:Transcript_7513/g.20593  ORF Transcript_7513/g.20593 Transcript_7513/m.20593 type:complete len:796 (+) Transcript_7513:82-2469(+)